MSFISIIIKILSILPVLLVIGVILLRVFQNKLLYIPRIPGHSRSPQEEQFSRFQNPKNAGIENYQDVEILTSDNIKLRGWLVKQEDSINHPTIIYFHENAGNLGLRLQFIKQLTQRLSVNLLIVAYRGYSDSEGSPTEEGLMLDSMAIFKFAKECKEIDNTRIFIYGCSLGGAVAIYCTLQNQYRKDQQNNNESFNHQHSNPDQLWQLPQRKNQFSSVPLQKNQHNWKDQFQIVGLIIENTFTSIPDMVDKIFGVFSFVKTFALQNFWPSELRIKQIKVPMMFIQSMQDELIPPEQMTRLMNATESCKFKDVHRVFHGHHNDAWTEDPDLYFNKIELFLDKCQLL